MAIQNYCEWCQDGDDDVWKLCCILHVPVQAKKMWFSCIFSVCGKYYGCIMSNEAVLVCVPPVLKCGCFQSLKLPIC